MTSVNSVVAMITDLNMQKVFIMLISFLAAASMVAAQQVAGTAQTLAAASMVVDTAQTVDAEPKMTLKDCMAYAISNSTKMRIQQAANGDARIDRRDAILMAFTPQITSQTYAYYNFGRSIDPQTNTYFNTTSFYNGYQVQAGFDLFNGFQAVSNIKISKTALQMGVTQEKQVEADICLSVMEAYYNVVYFTKLQRLFEEQVQTAKSSLKLAKRQEELGQKGHADVVQMEADLADREYDLVNNRSQLNTQLLNLRDLMYWPLDSVLNIETDIEDAGNSLPSGDVNSVADYALSNNPGVQIAGWKLLNAERALNTAKWQLMPKLSLYAGWDTRYYSYKGSSTDPFHSQFKNNAGEYVQLSLTLPIFNRLSKYSTIARKKHAVATASAEYDQKRHDVDAEVRKAFQDSDDALAAWQQASRKEEVQDEAYRLNSRKLEQGLISPIEYRTATDNYLKAKADKYNSLYKYLIKQSVVRYYGGEEYINQF